MPYINVTTSVSLTKEKRDAVRNAVWQAVQEIPGKTPEVTMVQINDAADIMKSTGEPAMFIDTRVFTAAPFAAKNKYCAKLGELLCPMLGIDPKMVYINVLQFNEWGSGSGYNQL